jgi:hypothetical protein
MPLNLIGLKMCGEEDSQTEWARQTVESQEVSPQVIEQMQLA